MDWWRDGGWMDSWIDVWMEGGWMDGWMDGSWINGCGVWMDVGWNDSQERIAIIYRLTYQNLRQYQ